MKKKIDDVAKESFLRGMEEATADANAKWQIEFEGLRQDFNEEKRSTSQISYNYIKRKILKVEKCIEYMSSHIDLQ